MGEDLVVYRRSDTLRCFLMKADTVYGHNSGESLKWAPKVHGLSTLISQANGQSLKQYDDTFQYKYIYFYIYRCTCEDDYTILFFQPEYIYMLWLFYLLI